MSTIATREELNTFLKELKNLSNVNISTGNIKPIEPATATATILSTEVDLNALNEAISGLNEAISAAAAVREEPEADKAKPEADAVEGGEEKTADKAVKEAGEDAAEGGEADAVEGGEEKTAETADKAVKEATEAVETAETAVTAAALNVEKQVIGIIVDGLVEAMRPSVNASTAESKKDKDDSEKAHEDGAPTRAQSDSDIVKLLTTQRGSSSGCCGGGFTITDATLSKLGEKATKESENAATHLTTNTDDGTLTYHALKITRDAIGSNISTEAREHINDVIQDNTPTAEDTKKEGCSIL